MRASDRPPRRAPKTPTSRSEAAPPRRPTSRTAPAAKPPAPQKDATAPKPGARPKPAARPSPAQDSAPKPAARSASAAASSKSPPAKPAADPSTKPARAGKPAYHHGDLRRVLLDVSVELIATAGVEALSLREVARAAGVSPAAPYHHFASKAELLGAIAARGFTGLTAAMRQALGAMAEPDEPTGRLAALGSAYIEFARSHPTEFRLMFRPSLVRRADLPLDCDPTSSFSLLLDAVARVSRALPIDGVTPEALTLGAWSLVHGAAELLLDGPLVEVESRLPISPERVGPTVVGVLQSLLRSAGARRPSA